MKHTKQEIRDMFLENNNDWQPIIHDTLGFFTVSTAEGLKYSVDGKEWFSDFNRLKARKNFDEKEAARKKKESKFLFRFKNLISGIAEDSKNRIDEFFNGVKI
jgi:hypothetical protein